MRVAPAWVRQLKFRSKPIKWLKLKVICAQLKPIVKSEYKFEAHKTTNLE